MDARGKHSSLSITHNGPLHTLCVTFNGKTSKIETPTSTKKKRLHNVYKSKQRGVSCGSAVAVSIPFALLLLAASLWVRFLPRAALVPFLLWVGSIFALLVAKIIVAHVSRQPFPTWRLGSSYFAFMLAFVFAAVEHLEDTSPRRGLWALLPFVQEVSGGADRHVAMVFGAAAALEYALYAMSVIAAICAELDVNCFTIKHRKVDSSGRKLTEKSK